MVTQQSMPINRQYAKFLILAGSLFTFMLLFYAFSSIPSGRPPVDLVLRDYEVSSGSVGHVLVLSPLKNAQETLPIFFSNLEKMEYPRDKISVGFLVSDSVDNTIPMVEEYANRIQSSGKPFHKFTVLRKDYHFELGGDKARHEYDVQIKRRDIMARSRSFLLTSTLTPEIDWVLWMDSDVIEYQTTLIQDLIKWKSKGDVIVPQCNWHSYNEEGGFDLNNWQETPESLAFKESIDKNFVLIEGYKARLDTKRKLMIDLFDAQRNDPNYIVPLDGVGGCCIIVKAQVHREGAIFPSFPVDHQVETEGFAQMAKNLGFRLIGLPDYRVFHILNG